MASLLKVLSIIFYIICFGGFIFQVSDLFNLYFKYQMITELTVAIPDELSLPDLNFCVRYIDIFEYERFTSKTGVKITFNPHNVTTKRVQTAEITTISELFDYTPSVDDLFNDCVIKKPSSHQYVEKVGKDCYTLFSVTKYYVQEYICYRFHLKPYANSTYYYNNLAYSLTHQGMIYAIGLKLTVFRPVNRFKAIISENGPKFFPTKSIAFAPDLLRNYNETTKLAQYSYFKASYGYLFNNLLPPPYPTKCRHYASDTNFVNQPDCRMKCLTKLTLKSFNKVPFAYIISEKVNYRHLSLIDILNNSTELDKDELECRDKCAFNDCIDYLSFTYVSQEENGRDENDFRFQVSIPREPFVSVLYLPKIEFSELLIYVLSCVGTWFGVSIISLDPVKLIVRCVKKRERSVESVSLFDKKGCVTRNNLLMKQLRDELIHLKYENKSIKFRLVQLEEKPSV